MDGKDNTRWGGSKDARNGWLEVDLGKPTAITRAVLKEISYPAIEEFAIEARQADGTWKNVATGTTIGSQKELKFPATTAQVFRLHLLKTREGMNIEEFQLWEK